MGQINIRIPDDDYYLLEKVAKRKNVPITSLFRLITSDSFNKWKLETVVEMHLRGEVGFKKALALSGLSPFELLHELEKSTTDPLELPTVDARSLEVALGLSAEDVFGKGHYKRKAPFVD